ncbi:MAG: isochorismatase family protein [Actinobacteria bacterium]|nr:isochorismatase family protein [Actinomycetota bacterium]
MLDVAILDMDEKQMNRLAGLLIAETTAVLTMELQNGVVGAGALMKALVDEVERVGVRATAGRLCTAARVRGIQVVHCVAENRPDGRGATDNCKVFAMNNRLRRETGSTPIDQGTVGVKLVAELGPDERDIVVPRIHGLTPFTQTSLDQILRNMSIRTLVVTGVSVNMGIFGTVMSAVDLGYNVIIVRDGVCGVPREYSDAVLENSLSLLATIASADDVIAAWG